MPDNLVSFDQMRERRLREEGRELIAESQRLRLKLRELVDRLRRGTGREIGRL
jgi:hypothetical protein